MPFKTNILASGGCIVVFIFLSCNLLAQKTISGKKTSK